MISDSVVEGTLFDKKIQMGVWLFKMLMLFLFLFLFLNHRILCLASWYLMGITVKKCKKEKIIDC
jgi:hypothetical protein